MGNLDLIAPKHSAQPLVSVIMNCYNGEKYLREAIDSVMAQNYQNWEIVFWDNASKDRSADIVHSYKDGRLRYFCGETTIPLGHARNRAIAQCQGDLIAFLDSDDLWLPEKLITQVPLFLDDHEIGLVYSDVNYFNQAGEVRRLYSIRRPYRGRCFERLITDYCLCLSTCMVRKSVLNDLDYWFDESLNMCEEMDLFFRISLLAKIDFTSDVLAMYRVHSENWTAHDPESVISESETILDKLERLSVVRECHAGSVEIARQKLARQEAKLAWRNGDAVRARQVIRDKLPFSIRAMILTIATLFPFGPIDYVYRKITGVVRQYD